MENLISEELLSEVLEKEVSIWDKNEIKNNILEIGISLPSGGRLYKELNIYELAHKCKEWALSQGYILESLTNRSCIIGNNFEYFATVKIHKETNSMIEHNINENTEIEVVVNACQWILDNKESK